MCSTYYSTFYLNILISMTISAATVTSNGAIMKHCCLLTLVSRLLASLVDKPNLTHDSDISGILTDYKPLSVFRDEVP